MELSHKSAWGTLSAWFPEMCQVTRWIRGTLKDRGYGCGEGKEGGCINQVGIDHAAITNGSQIIIIKSIKVYFLLM
jgi:hypothetical protein